MLRAKKIERQARNKENKKERRVARFKGFSHVVVMQENLGNCLFFGTPCFSSGLRTCLKQRHVHARDDRTSEADGRLGNTHTSRTTTVLCQFTLTCRDERGLQPLGGRSVGAIAVHVRPCAPLAAPSLPVPLPLMCPDHRTGDPPQQGTVQLMQDPNPHRRPLSLNHWSLVMFLSFIKKF